MRRMKYNQLNDCIRNTTGVCIPRKNSVWEKIRSKTKVFSQIKLLLEKKLPKNFVLDFGLDFQYSKWIVFDKLMLIIIKRNVHNTDLIWRNFCMNFCLGLNKMTCLGQFPQRDDISEYTVYSHFVMIPKSELRRYSYPELRESWSVNFTAKSTENRLSLPVHKNTLATLGHFCKVLKAIFWLENSLPSLCEVHSCWCLTNFAFWDKTIVQLVLI